MGPVVALSAVDWRRAGRVDSDSRQLDASRPTPAHREAPVDRRLRTRRYIELRLLRRPTQRRSGCRRSGSRTVHEDVDDRKCWSLRDDGVGARRRDVRLHRTVLIFDYYSFLGFLYLR